MPAARSKVRLAFFVQFIYQDGYLLLVVAAATGLYYAEVFGP